MDRLGIRIVSWLGVHLRGLIVLILMMHEIFILLFLDQGEERIIILQFTYSPRLKAYFLRLLLS
jgi:hypothetical protein